VSVVLNMSYGVKKNHICVRLNNIYHLGIWVYSTPYIAESTIYSLMLHYILSFKFNHAMLRCYFYVSVALSVDHLPQNRF